MLAIVIILSLVSSLLAVSVAQSSKVGISSTAANKISLQAQQYASADADIVRMTAYSDLANTAKTLIAGTQFYKEILVGQEQDYSGEIKWANTYTQNSSLPNVAPDYIDFDASRVVPTAIENRPINRAVRYFIRAA